MYRSAVCPIVIVAALLCLSPSLRAQTGDADTKAFVSRYEQAFTAGDAKALTALHTKDAIRLGADGELLVGHAAIEKHIAAGFAGPLKRTKLVLTLARTQEVSADVRIIQGTFEVTGGSVGTFRGRYVNTLTRRDGQWLLASVVAVQDATGAAASPPSR